MKDNALIIFVKNFSLENVKTRLAVGLGKEKALEAYKELVQITSQVTQNVQAQRYVFWDQFIPEVSYPFPEDCQQRVQVGNDLGQRMENAFREILRFHSRVCIIGTDCPFLHEEIMREAFESLSELDFCIGPALDGGYYLLGVKTHVHIWFRDMEWSTSTVFEKTLEKAKQAQLNGYVLPVLRDIDTVEDYKNWKGLSTI